MPTTSELLPILLHRRSVRRYSGEPVSREQLELIVRAGLLSPTGRNRRDWEFVVVRDPATLEALIHVRAGGAAGMLSGAAAAIAVFGDTQATDVWCEDCSIALSNMHLMADSLGLGSCWIQGRLRAAEDGRPTCEAVRELLGVPERYELEAMLSVGVPSARPAPHELPEVADPSVHWDLF